MKQLSAYFQYVLAFYSLISVDAGRNSFSALIAGNWYLNELYLQEWNEDENSELDPATGDASARLQICNDVSHSAIFEQYGMRPVNMEEVYDELRQPKYSHIFHRIYRPSNGSKNAQHPYTYTNPYMLQKFRIRRVARNPPTTFIDAKESVFVCLLRRVERNRRDYLQERANMYENDPMRTGLGGGESSTRTGEGPNQKNPSKGSLNEIVPVYVTKAYDLKFGLHVHHYVHLDLDEFAEDELILADRSAEAYSRPDFNIELHYLELRKHHQPAPSIPADPILRYKFGDDQQRLTRICTIVTTSSYFQERFERKVHLVYRTIIVKREISFRTSAGKQKANGRRYYESLISCTVHFSNKHFVIVYISRAYNPFQVFLYHSDRRSGKLHLEMLATGVSMAQDRHNLGDVEI